jgi:RsiW-degrading membrane proteinase PrsW (M82 family)
MAGITTNNVIFAVFGGFLPVILWLWFWLREDPHPEPKKIILLTFFYGMVTVAIAMLFEYGVKIYFSGAIMFLLWAIIEEILKYLAANNAALKRPSYDEPVDALVYMITAALGFACLENILFIFKAVSSEGMLVSLITGNLRFIGATLLHASSSAIVGASLAFSFFHKESRRVNLLGGLLLASFLHFLFNYFIIKNSGENILKIFIPLWIVTIVIFFIFEKVKRIKSI